MKFVKGLLKGIVIVVVAFVALAIVATIQQSIHPRGGEQTTAESKTEKATKEETTKKSEKDDKVVLYEDKNFKITYLGYDKMNMVSVIYPNIKIENKTEKDIKFVFDDAYVNDNSSFVIYGITSEINAGKTCTQSYGFSYGNTDVEKDEEVEKIEFKFVAYDKNLNTITETKTLVIRPND